MRPLLAEINDDRGRPSPALWWLGHAGFAVKHQGIVFYIDPCLASPPGPHAHIRSAARA